MTDSHNAAHPNLEDLGDYLQGLAQVLIQRDAQQQAHELKLAEVARLEKIDESARTIARRAEEAKVATDRDVQRQAHEFKLSEVARLEKIDESARAIARRAEEAKVAADRDAQRQAHELKLADIARLAAQDDADRTAKQQMDKLQTERAEALEALRLERARLAHLIDQVPVVAAELDAMIANAHQLDPQRLLPEVRKELHQLPALFESLSRLTSGGLSQSDLVALHPKGLFQIGVAVPGLTAMLNRCPARGMGRFVKIGESSEHLPAFALKWVAVLDTAENLIWERKTEGGTHSVHRKFTNLGKDQPGDSGQYVIEVNRERFVGKSDWRMPTVDELAALYIAMDRRDWGLVTVDLHWASPSSPFNNLTELVSFGGGSREMLPRTIALPVRLVRSGQ